MTYALSVEHLSKTYANGTHALKGISFSVEQGDFFALLGPNGAGKSTTIGIVTSLVNKTAGNVKIFDYDLDTQLAKAKSCVGLVPQEFNFNIFTKVSDILLNQAGFYGIPRKIAFERAEKYLTQLGLWEKRNGPAIQLSGGMKRRLMIARALVHEPKLLILDEPTAGVDIEIRRSLWNFLQEINKAGTTVILTTHYLEEAEMLCRNIAIINEGKVIEHDSMQSVLRKLHQETFILYFEQPVSMPPSFVRKIDEYSVEMDLVSGETLTDVIEKLSGHNIKVKTMRNKTNRLEELFVNLTRVERSQ
ncbi:MAG: ABC transporter ATP-binding protein [Gammaproteobacteria bacterium]|nr:ABC transporter ATP-binding protein [Gammaproteobacteria bacterium]